MKNKKLLSILFMFLTYGLGLANRAPNPGNDGRRPPAPIDTNEFILIIAAVLLTVGVIAYKKLSLKKA